MPGPALSLPEREEIFRALTLDADITWAELARRVNRHPTTITREVQRNGGRTLYRPTLGPGSGHHRTRFHQPGGRGQGLRRSR